MTKHTYVIEIEQAEGFTTVSVTKPYKVPDYEGMIIANYHGPSINDGMEKAFAILRAFERPGTVLKEEGHNQTDSESVKSDDNLRRKRKHLNQSAYTRLTVNQLRSEVLTRLKKLENYSHIPYDFTDLISRVTKLETSQTDSVKPVTQKGAEEEIRKLRYELACCLSAAIGNITRPVEAAKEGQRGWTPAFQKVLDLRMKFDELEKWATGPKGQHKSCVATFDTQEKEIARFRTELQNAGNYWNDTKRMQWIESVDRCMFFKEGATYTIRACKHEDYLDFQGESFRSAIDAALIEVSPPESEVDVQGLNLTCGQCKTALSTSGTKTATRCTYCQVSFELYKPTDKFRRIAYPPYPNANCGIDCHGGNCSKGYKTEDECREVTAKAADKAHQTESVCSECNWPLQNGTCTSYHCFRNPNRVECAGCGMYFVKDQNGKGACANDRCQFYGVKQPEPSVANETKQDIHSSAPTLAPLHYCFACRQRRHGGKCVNPKCHLYYQKIENAK